MSEKLSIRLSNTMVLSMSVVRSTLLQFRMLVGPSGKNRGLELTGFGKVVPEMYHVKQKRDRSEFRFYQSFESQNTSEL